MKRHDNHNALKEVAKKYLEGLGFTSDQIHEEYSVSGNGMLQALRVDVVGINGKRKVAVECGLTSGEKLAALKLFFDTVIVLPFFSLNTDEQMYKRIIEEQKATIASLQEDNAKLRTENRHWDDFRDKFRDKIFASVIRALLENNIDIPYIWNNQVVDRIRKELNAELQNKADQSVNG